MTRNIRLPVVETIALAAVLLAGVIPSAQAGFTVADGDKGKLEVEARMMFWADASGRQSVVDQEERVEDFFIRRARIVVQGKTGDSLSFSLQLGQDNIGARVLSDDASIRIKDAYVSYRVTDSLSFTLGQFKIPLLRANLESGFNQLLADRGTLPTLRPAREGSRDLGAMAWGNVGASQYRLALFDGSDQEAKNSRSSFRIAGRLAHNWFGEEKGLGYTGTYQGTRRMLQMAGQFDAQNSRFDPRDGADYAALRRDYRTFALDGFFEQPFARDCAVTLEGAWFDRRDDYQDDGVATRNIQGFYAQSGLLLPGNLGPGRLQVALRYEDWDTKRGSARSTTRRTTGGATYFIRGHDWKLQADYTRKQEKPEIKNDEFRFSAVTVF